MAGFGRCSCLRGEVKEAKLGQADRGEQEMGTVGMGLPSGGGLECG